VSVHIDTLGTETVSVAKITRAVNRVFSFQPSDIVAQLNLLRPFLSVLLVAHEIRRSSGSVRAGVYT
jgi:S-adenosylmethionine synthetase